MNRREFLTGAAAAALFAAAPGLAQPASYADDPMGLLGLIDDGTYASYIVGKVEIDPHYWMTLKKHPSAIVRFLDMHQRGFEDDALEKYGRRIRFEAVEEDGTPFVVMPERDVVQVIFVGRDT